jgi:hypothetical protein
MPSSIHAALSPAGIASTEPLALSLKGVDFVTGYCGLSPPTLFERIGIMAAESPGLAARVLVAHQPCARVPVKAYSDSIASGSAQRVGSRIRMGDRQGGSPGLSILRGRHRLPSCPDDISGDGALHARAGPIA